MPHNVSLPQNSRQHVTGREIFSFDREAPVTLGFYEPGKTATLIDPASSGARFPWAIIAHELAHQSLMINTTFGIFTQTINSLRKRGFASDDVFQTCHEVQWMVQEAVATYAEMAVVAREAPAKLAGEINALPTSRNIQPPYREAFETIASWLPLDAGDDETTVRAKEFLVEFLGFAAMNTDCLRRGLAGQPTEKLLFECMADTPDDRFTRLLAAVGKDRGHLILLDRVHRHIVQMTNTATGPANRHGWKAAVLGLKQHLLKLLPQRRGNSRAEQQFNISLMQNIRALSDHAIAWEDDIWETEVFMKARERLLAFWRPTLPNLYWTRHVEDPLPMIAFDTERATRKLAKNPPQRLAEGAIEDFAAKATKQKLAIMIQLVFREGDSSVAHVTLGAYVPARQDEVWPGKVSEEQAAAMPRDIRGLATPEMVLRELKDFPPMVVQILNPSSMRTLAQVPGSHALFRRAIRVCRLTELSLELVEDAVNEFGGRQGFFFPIGEKLYLGCILKKDAEAFVIVPLTSDASTNLFVSICGRLKIRSLEDPDSFYRERGLLSMIDGFAG